MAHHAEAPDHPRVKPHWGQRLGNAIAIVTLVVAVVAIWLLQSRVEPGAVQNKGRAPAIARPR